MIILTRILAALLAILAAIYLIDLWEGIYILDFHEKVPPKLFGVLWTLVGLIVLAPGIYVMHSRHDNK